MIFTSEEHEVFEKDRQYNNHADFTRLIGTPYVLYYYNKNKKEFLTPSPKEKIFCRAARKDESATDFVRAVTNMLSDNNKEKGATT